MCNFGRLRVLRALSKVSVIILGVAFGCNISLNNFSLSLVAISPLGEAKYERFSMLSGIFESENHG